MVKDASGGTYRGFEMYCEQMEPETSLKKEKHQIPRRIGAVAQLGMMKSKPFTNDQPAATEEPLDLLAEDRI